MALPAGLRCVPLASAPDYAAELADLLMAQRQREGARGDLAQVRARLAAEIAGQAALPYTVLGLCDEALVGVATLTHYPGRLAPADALWLTNLWVRPAQRRRGIGTALVQAQTLAARRLNAAQLHLYTRDHQDYYRRLGWSLARTAEIAGATVSIMTLALG